MRFACNVVEVINIVRKLYEISTAYLPGLWKSKRLRKSNTTTENIIPLICDTFAKMSA